MATSSKNSAAPAQPVKTVPVKKAPAKAVTSKKTVATPVAQKAPVKTAAVKPAASKKITAPDVKLRPSTAPKPVLTTEQRNHYVSVAAFYIAERRGFTLGCPQDDWLAAEAEIDRLIASGHFAF